MLVTPTSSLSQAARTTLADEGVQHVYVVGGQLAVTNTVVKQLESMGVDVFRVPGADATDTSQELARFELAATKNKGRQWSASAEAVLARGHPGHPRRDAPVRYGSDGAHIGGGLRIALGHRGQGLGSRRGAGPRA